MKFEKTVLIIFLIIAIILTFTYSLVDEKIQAFLIEYETGVVERVIDGDTIVVNGESVRLLGINSPERGEKYYQESKKFLERELLDKEVRLYFGKQKKDKYKRTLAYVYFNNRNINAESVREGFSNYYFPDGRDKYYQDLMDAWYECLEKNVNLCKISQNPLSKCVDLEIYSKQEKIVLENICNFEIDLTSWELKEQGRKKYIFDKTEIPSREELFIIIGEGENNDSYLYWNEKDLLGEKKNTFFLRDSEGGLVIWKDS